MFTTEAVELGAWLRDAADGKVEPTMANAAGEVYPSLDFLEPILGFGFEARVDDDVILRVVPEERLRDAATTWLEELRPFPELVRDIGKQGREPGQPTGATAADHQTVRAQGRTLVSLLSA